ncbi:MAG: MFS transporter [Holosporales bacterium]|jgi:MFS family permease|nr:MFS transporter [Holosporales bacterium]
MQDNTSSDRSKSGQLSDASTASPSSRQRRDGKIPLTVWQIGLMMFLMNTAFVMTYSFSGLYLKHAIGVSAIFIGFLEGICETISHLMKLLSGMLSDYLGNRKRIMICGYILSVLSRPLLAISNSFILVFSARAAERFGNGIQGSPRDAIVADIAPRKKIGASYGLKRSLAYLGSLCGGALGFYIMKWTGNNYQCVFALASIPAIAALLILLFFVKEPNRFDHPAITSEAPMPSPKLKPKFSFKSFRYLSSAFWLLMLINFIFMMARMNETFLILRMNEGFQPDPMFAPVVMIIFNIGTSISSYPIGIVGDRFDRIKILFIGMAFLIIADILMFSAMSSTIMCIGILFWGMQLGTTQNVFVSLIAEKVPEDLRGTGLGIYWLINAISAFVADTLAGFVAHHVSLNCIFVSSGIIGVTALLVLALIVNTIQHGFRSRKR